MKLEGVASLLIAADLLMGAVGLVAVSVPPAGPNGTSAAGAQASAGAPLFVGPASGSAALLSIVKNLTVGALPAVPVYDAADGDVYVSNGDSNNVTVVHGLSVVGTVPAGTGPFAPVVDPKNGYVYVPNMAQADGNNTTSVVNVINGTTLVGSVSVGSCPGGGAFDPADGFVYFTSCDQNITVINGTAAVGTVPGTWNLCAGGARYDPSDGDVYVADQCSSTLKLVNGTSLVGSVAVGVDPFAMTYDPSNGYLYVPCQGSGLVSVVSGTTVVANVSVGSNPISAVFDSGNGLVYVPDQGLSPIQGVANLSLINGTTRVATVNVGSYPTSQAAVSAQYASGTGYIFATNSGSLVAVGGKTIAGNLSFSGWPLGAAFDPQNQYLYVSVLAGNNSGSLSVVTCQACLGVTLAETGSPTGSAWSLSASNASTWFAESASAAAPESISLYLTPGTYALTVTAVKGTTVEVVSGNAMYLEGSGRILVGGLVVHGGGPGSPSGGLPGWVAYPIAVGSAAAVAAAVASFRVRRRRRGGEELLARMRRAVENDPDTAARILQ